jgi:hypothetical protein
MAYRHKVLVMNLLVLRKGAKSFVAVCQFVCDVKRMNVSVGWKQNKDKEIDPSSKRMCHQISNDTEKCEHSCVIPITVRGRSH